VDRDREIKAEMSQLIGDPAVRKAVRYFELKELLEERKQRRGRLALQAEVRDTNWGDSES
jgi:hypothetical protein